MTIRPFLDPVAFHIGQWPIHWYGFILSFSIVVGVYWAALQAEYLGENSEHVWNASLMVVVCGVTGARLYHVVHEWEALYKDNPLAVFYLWYGGLAIYGALAGGVLALAVYCLSNKLSLLHWLDIAAPGISLAQAIGRWGNYFNQELYGTPTDGPLAVYIEPQYRVPGYEGYERFHPLFLYESLWNLLVFGVLLYLSRRARLRLLTGDVFLLYLTLYSIGRVVLEAVKIGDVWTIAGIRTAQLIGGVLIVACGVLLAYRHRTRRSATT